MIESTVRDFNVLYATENFADMHYPFKYKER